MSDGALPPRIGDCWNRIGLYGDQSCPELPNVTHCRNCFVFASAGRVLLERTPTESYRKAVTREYAEVKKHDDSPEISIVVFRLGREFYALPTRAFAEIALMSTIRKIPHKRDPVLLGVTSVRGEVLLCVSLAALFDVDRIEEPSVNARDARLMILNDDGATWAAPVDELEGIFHCPEARLREAPSTVSRSAADYCRGIIEFEREPIALIDENRLFEGVKRSLR